MKASAKRYPHLAGLRGWAYFCREWMEKIGARAYWPASTVKKGVMVIHACACRKSDKPGVHCVEPLNRCRVWCGLQLDLIKNPPHWRCEAGPRVVCVVVGGLDHEDPDGTIWLRDR